jgi:hypothetical protein
LDAIADSTEHIFCVTITKSADADTLSLKGARPRYTCRNFTFKGAPHEPAGYCPPVGRLTALLSSITVVVNGRASRADHP